MKLPVSILLLFFFFFFAKLVLGHFIDKFIFPIVFWPNPVNFNARLEYFFFFFFFFLPKKSP